MYFKSLILARPEINERKKKILRFTDRLYIRVKSKKQILENKGFVKDDRELWEEMNRTESFAFMAATLDSPHYDAMIKIMNCDRCHGNFKNGNLNLINYRNCWECPECKTRMLG